MECKEVFLRTFHIRVEHPPATFSNSKASLNFEIEKRRMFWNTLIGLPTCGVESWIFSYLKINCSVAMLENANKSFIQKWAMPVSNKQSTYQIDMKLISISFQKYFQVLYISHMLSLCSYIITKCVRNCWCCVEKGQTKIERCLTFIIKRKQVG